MELVVKDPSASRVGPKIISVYSRDYRGVAYGPSQKL